MADAKSSGHKSHADHAHKQDHSSAMAKIARMAETTNAATPTAASPVPATKPAAPKPSCNPNFTLDAQGEKHFKPECF